MKRGWAVAGLVLAALAACGSPSQTPQQGAITDVVVVLKDSSIPLPFDPRGGRLTVVTQQIAALVGHPIVLELDTALSPELRASLEETVLASFETIAKELVILQKEDPAMFADAKAIKRVECHYDAVAKESDGVLSEGGTVLDVRSPPDRFPLLERGVLLDAVYTAHIEELDKRWGDLDPTRVPPNQESPWFTYMIATRPGAGYLWVAARASNQKPGSWDRLRAEHVDRIVRFAGTLDPKSPLGVKVRKWLLEEQLTYVGTEPSTQPNYSAWLNRTIATFDDDDRLTLAKAVYHGRDAVKLQGFDRFAFGMSIYDAWTAGKVHGELEKLVVCPLPRHGEAETEIHYGCSGFFDIAFAEDADRLAGTITKRNDDQKLLEIALLNLGYGQGKIGVAFIEKLASRRALFEDGVRILFHDYARRDDVKDALQDATPRWWRDYPTERGLTLLVMGRRSEGLHPMYADNQWTRFTAEFGGPVKRDVMTAFLAEGARAMEMTPKMWLAFAKGPDRDELVAKNLPLLLNRGGKATGPLGLLRKRYCDEKDAAGLASSRNAISEWLRTHPDAPAAVSNAVVDFTLQRCAKPIKDDEDDWD